MKKLLITITAIAIGVAANAASYTWTVASGRLYDGAASPAYLTEGTTAYLMFVSVATQDSLVEKFNAGTAAAYVAENSLGTGSVNNAGRIGDGSGTASVRSEQTAYFVIFANDMMYVSDTATAAYDALDASPIAFGGQASTSKTVFTSGTYTENGAGWYSTASVPEPTSGLLLLLGVASLALKRKCA